MKKLLLFIVFAAVFTFCACGESYEFDMQTLTENKDIYTELYDSSDIDSLIDATPDYAKEFLYELELSPKDPFSFANVTSKGAFKAFLEYLKNYILSPLKVCTLLITAILICALIKSMGYDATDGPQYTMNIAAALICIAAVMVPVCSLVQKAAGTIRVCSGFMIAFIPVFLGILIALMRSASAATLQPLMFFACQVVTYIGANVITPFCSMYLAVSVAASVSEGGRLKGFAEIIKKSATWILTGSMTVFMAILSIQTAIGSASDSVVNKTAKFFVGSFVPVIGASISEALSSVQSCVSLLKSSVGIYAIIVLLIILVPIIVEIVLWRFALMFCSSAAEMFSLNEIKAVTDSVQGALGILLSVTACVAVMFVFSITIISVAGGSL
ncbi:MAG: stage III sporulation protein AE [Clostridia bacterium]|nr:stage III sporulation protein AE [Clostridia bacterium]